MFFAFTDYPLLEDVSDENAPLPPIRQVTVLGYDYDKRVIALYKGQKYMFKAGYLYKKPGRIDRLKDEDRYTHRDLVRMKVPEVDWDDMMDAIG